MKSNSGFMHMVAFVLLLSPTVASALYGDCGQPNGSGTYIVTSDAQYLLNTAVGTPGWPAPLCVGDINNSSAITVADAQIALNESVNHGSQTLSCPSGSTCTACTQTAIGSRLTALTTGERVLRDTSTIFRCPAGGTTISIPTTWSQTIAVNNVIISAKDREIIFQSNHGATCPGSKPSTGFTFLRLTGNGIVLEDIQNQYFWNGVEIAAQDATYRSSSGTISVAAGSSFSCYAGVLNDASATGTELRGLTLSANSTGPGSNNGIHSNGNSISTSSPCTDADALHATSTNRSCYNLASYGSIMYGIPEPYDYNGKGRYLSYGDILNPGNPGCVTPSADQSGAGADVRVRVDGSDVSSCDTGLRVKGGARLATNNVFAGFSTYRGVWASDTAYVTLRNSDIEDNGGSTNGSYPYYGGVTTNSSGATIDMGSPSVAGNNVLCGNEDPSGYKQIHNVSGTITNYGNTVTNGACP